MQNKQKKRIRDRKYRENNKEKIFAKNRTPQRRYNTAKYDAKKRNIEFKLSFDYWYEEVLKPCFYCNDKLGKRSETSVGCDRKNNELGYIEGNILSCCIICNKIKNEFLSVDETIACVHAILKVRNNKG